jgi:hypothetical protein
MPLFTRVSIVEGERGRGEAAAAAAAAAGVAGFKSL